MQISFDLPDSFVQVVDTTNYKGVPISVLYIMGEEAAYFRGKADFMTNKDWEDCIKREIARFFGEMIVKRWSDDWSTENPTGRGINEPNGIHFVRDDENV